MFPEFAIWRCVARAASGWREGQGLAPSFRRSASYGRLFKLQVDSSNSAVHPNVPDAELSPSCRV